MNASKRKIAVITLGCEKNLIDSEMLLSWFQERGFAITTALDAADLILINTCAFIAAAKKEAIATIENVMAAKKKQQQVIVAGCLAERYLADLKALFPEVTCFLPLRSYNNLGKILAPVLKLDAKKTAGLRSDMRVISTPPYLAYLRISEGCNNFCTYCAIPLIRGKYRSVAFAEVMRNFKQLINLGYKEICLVGQNTTAYGKDLKAMNLSLLLREMCKVAGDFKIRLLYLYPDEIDAELLQTFKTEKKLMPYFDIPVQHGSDRILKLMGRSGNSAFLRALVKKIRAEVPGAVLRTTLIVGFPGETHQDFRILKDFVADTRFDHLGVFTYSREDGTRAYHFKGQVNAQLKERRKKEIMDIQKQISGDCLKRFVGGTYDAVVDGYSAENKVYYLRGYMQAPGDIDGLIIVKQDMPLEMYKSYRCQIFASDFFDLYGEVVKNDER